MTVDLAVIGGGSAGLAAAAAARENGIENILILEREHQLGGILLQCIHNGFGLHRFGEELTGPEYASRYVKKVKEMGIPYVTDCMVVDLSPDKVITAINPERGLMKIEAKAIVLATGCRERPRGGLATPGTRPAGVYTAGTAQKLLNRAGMMPGKKVVILGSGDIGLIMARRFTLQGAKVELVAKIMPYSSGLARNIAQCLDDFGIPLLLNHTVTDIKGRERVEGVVISEVDERRKPIPGTEKLYECDTLLLSCGLIPENELAMGAGIELSNATKGAIVSDSYETSIPGIFACGNSLHVHDLVDNVSEESEAAGKCAAEYILGKESSDRFIPVFDGDNASGSVPQKVAASDERPVKIMFRPRSSFRNAVITVLADGTEIARKKKLTAVPGEMEEIVVKAGAIPAGTQKITVVLGGDPS